MIKIIFQILFRMPPKTIKPKFQMPQIEGKNISPASVKIYTNRLSHLADLDIVDVQGLLDNAEAVIELVEMICDTDATTAAGKEAEKLEKRQWLAAIDYALFDTPDKDKILYTQYYDTLWKKGGTYKAADGTMKPWVPHSEYVKLNKK